MENDKPVTVNQNGSSNERCHEVLQLESDKIFDKGKMRPTLELAMSVLQYKLKDIKKTSKVEKKYQYLDLPELLSQIYEWSGNLGLRFKSTMGHVSGELFFVTVSVVHRVSGETDESTVYGYIREADIPRTKIENKLSMNYAQWVGACITYMRRYATCNLLHICADDDNDLNKYNGGYDRN
jgi:hypothetical protein